MQHVTDHREQESRNRGGGKKRKNDWEKDGAQGFYNDFNESTKSPPDTLDTTPRN